MPDHNGIVIAANFTAEPLADSLQFWLRRLGWSDEIHFAPYNQVFQTLLDPGSVFAAHPKAAHVVLLRGDRVADAGQLRDAIRNFGKPVLVAYCEPAGELPEPAANELRLNGLLAKYPVADAIDAHAEQLGDIPYTPEYFAALGTAVIRAVHALLTRPFKVIALDCDNTLWRGTCGEDGPEGVVIDEPRRQLQLFMQAQREAGMLLTLASKNNEADVDETFRAHPEMPLTSADFIARRVNWEPKAAGLAAMADELALGADSFILVDDSAKEIAEMQAALPEVPGLELPRTDARIPHYLDHVWAFDRLQVTEEDRQRNEAYRQQVQRGQLERQAGSLEEFLRELRVEIHIQPMTEAQTARVAQLTQRTNQMNTTLIRRSEAEVRETECWTVDVSDRFGSYGLVGAIFLKESAEALVVDGFLLSCRALGRGVEHRMMEHIRELAVERGKARVEVPVVEGPRNAPAREFVRGGVPAKTDEKAKPIEAARVAVPADRIDYNRIARELSRPSQILDAIRAEKRSLAADRASSQQPRTELERQIAAVWAETLQVANPGVEEDFFDLGGHSLLAVQLFSAVRQELGVELSMDLVYSGRLTIAGMAAAVELAQADPEEMARLMAEIEGLSDEELRALLAEE